MNEQAKSPYLKTGVPTGSDIRKSFFNDFTERFGNELMKQDELISRIQSGLNDIFDKRKSEKTESEQNPMPIPDIVSRLAQLCLKLERNNIILGDIKNHLSEIV